MVVGVTGIFVFFFLMIRRPPRSTLDRASAASDVYKRQGHDDVVDLRVVRRANGLDLVERYRDAREATVAGLSLIHISEPTRPY